MDWEEILEKVGPVLEGEPRLVVLPQQGKAVFVGDTHGDLDASQQVIRRFLKKSHRIVFLGDYVDRGSFSKENLLFLLQMKREHPEEIFLLAGNHEGYRVKEFYPASFWESLTEKEREALGRLFCRFPLAATSENGILALHGALPELNSLEEVNRTEWGDTQWERMLWGDFVESRDDRMEDWGGRPQFGRPYFERLMERYRKRILIRSHQPMAPTVMFNKTVCYALYLLRLRLDPDHRHSGFRSRDPKRRGCHLRKNMSDESTVFHPGAGITLVQIRRYSFGINGLPKRGCFVARRLLATTRTGSCLRICHCERSEAISHFGHHRSGMRE